MVADKEDQVIRMEELRKKARLSYVYLGTGLLLVLAAGLFIAPVCLLGTGGIVLAAYWLLLRKDICRYRDMYRETVALNALGRYIRPEAYVPKTILSLDSVRQDGCVPMENTQGIVRAGISGSYRDGPVCLTDISYTYRLAKAGGRTRVIPVSGCYLRMELSADTGITAVFCSPQLLPDVPLDLYYEQAGLVRIPCLSIPYRSETLEESGTLYVENGCEERKVEAIGNIMVKLNRQISGQFVVKVDHRHMFGFVRGRYLGQREPDCKTRITAEQLDQDLFPEMRAFLDMADWLETQ